jgi:hypothetical protein
VLEGLRVQLKHGLASTKEKPTSVPTVPSRIVLPFRAEWVALGHLELKECPKGAHDGVTLHPRAVARAGCARAGWKPACRLEAGGPWHPLRGAPHQVRRALHQLPQRPGDEAQHQHRPEGDDGRRARRGREHLPAKPTVGGAEPEDALQERSL